MTTRLTAFFTAILMFFGSVIAMFIPSPPNALTENELAEYSDHFEPVATSDKIYAVNTWALTSDELNAVICLQGLVNRVEPCLYIIHTGADRSYLKEFERGGREIVTTSGSGDVWRFPTLVEKFRSYITDSGYTLYTPSDFAEGQNVACNYATAKGWLAVPESVKEAAEAAGLTMKLDLTADKYDIDFQYKHFKTLKDHFNKGVIIHVKQEPRGLRDFAISRGYYICYSDSTLKGDLFMSRILRFSGDNTLVLGWGENEKKNVEFLSKHGASIVPADFSMNNSYLSNYRAEKLTQTHPEIPEPDPEKHYVAIEMSDGDNSQWIQNGYASYYEKIALEHDFPMTWTFPLIQSEFGQAAAKQAYDAAGEYNSFIGGVSGIGYMNPGIFRVSALPEFTEQTAALALKSDIRIVSVLDEMPSALMMPSFKKKLSYYSRFDNIDGGILMLDPDRYASGHGMVIFSNDKPFLSVRLSLWYPGGETSEVTDEWIREQADIVNSFPADISSINGYSLINVHPWSINTDDLALFVSLLDDHTELVSVEQLLGMIAENCPHKDVAPGQ